MNEAEWLTCTDPGAMLKSLRGRAGGRKLRLFACAYARRAWPRLSDRRSRRGIETSESYADGLVEERELRAAWQAAYRAAQELSSEQEDEAAWAACRAAQALPAWQAAE